MISSSAPLISIIVAVFNSKETLQQCIDSVSQQSYLNKELIIIDGGSKDGSLDVLNLNQNSFAYCVSESDHGIYNAWNKGLVHAKGEWICFLGADDFLWNPTVLERMAVQLQMLPLYLHIAYGQVVLIDADGEPIQTIGELWEQVKETFRMYMNIPHIGTMHRRELFAKHGMFDESFQIAGDYELLLRELVTGDAKFIPNIIVAGQRLGGISTDKNNNFQIILEVCRARRIHGLAFQWGRVFFQLKAVLRENTIIYIRLVLVKVLGMRLAKRLLAARRNAGDWPR